MKICKIILSVVIMPIFPLLVLAQNEQKIELLVESGHSHQVQCVAFALDKKTLASSGSDGTIKLWDAASGQQLTSLEGHADSVESVVFSPNGKLLASGSWDKTIKLWSVESGELVKTLAGHLDKIHSITFSPDGKTLASGSDDQTVRIWNVESGQQIKLLEGQAHSVFSVAFSPNGKTLASSGFDNAIRLWNLETGQQIKSLENGHFSLTVSSVAFSPDGKTLASGSWDKTINLWNVESGEIIESLRGHADSVTSIAFSSDLKTLISGGKDGKIILWNIKNGEILKSFIGHSNSVSSVKFISDGKILASGSLDNSVKLWSVESGELIKSLENHADLISDVAISPDGKTLASGSRDKPIKLWNIERGELIKSFTERSNRRGLFQRGLFHLAAFSPDGNMLANSSSQSKINLWNVATGQKIKLLEGHPNYLVWSVAFSPDGETLASSGSDSTIKLWNVETGQLIKTLKGHSDEVLSVAFSPDGKMLASGSKDYKVRIWNAETGQIVQLLKGHNSWVRSVAFSPDGKTLASGSEDETIKLWLVESGKLIETFSGHDDLVSSVAFSPDGKLLASGSWDKTVKLWNVENGKLLESLKGHAAAVQSVTFSPNGRFLVSGSLDAAMKLWNTKSKNLLATLISIDEDDWIITTPDGRFDTNKSLDGIEGLHWIVNDEILKPLPLDVFMRQYYEPELLQRVLKCAEENDCETEFNPLPSIAEINRVQPKVLIKEIRPIANSADSVNVTIKVENITEEVGISASDGTKRKQMSSGAFDLRLFCDGQLVGVSAPKELLEKYIKDAPQLVEEGKVLKSLLNTPEDKAWREANDLEKVVKFENNKAVYTFKNIKILKDGRDSIEFSAYAFNADRVKSATARTIFKIEQPETKTGKTYLITIGVNDSENPQYRLRYAANDARKMQEILGSRLNTVNQKLIQIPLISDYDQNGVPTDNSATKPIIKGVFSLLAGRPEEVNKAVLEKINKIAQIEPIQPEDTLIITFSGHGYADRGGIFYLLPFDVGKNTKSLTAAVLPNLISSDELSLWMRDVTAKEMLMVIDACHSAAAVQGSGFKPGPMGSRGLGQLAYDKDMKILSATQADNVALELGSLQQGLLSYALLEDGIVKSLADIDKNKKLFSNEWLTYAEKRVPELYGEVRAGKRDVVIGGKTIKAGEKGVEIIETENQKNSLNLQQPTVFDFKRRVGKNAFLILP